MAGITVTGGLDNPNINLWGGGCGGILAVGCGIGTLQDIQIVAGNTYFVN